MKNKALIIIIIFIISICALLVECAVAGKNNKKDEETIFGRYVLIDKVGNGIDGFSRLVYDKDTYVMYVFNDESMSPYYIVKDKEAIVGIYNVNWFGD